MVDKQGISEQSAPMAARADMSHQQGSTQDEPRQSKSSLHAHGRPDL